MKVIAQKVLINNELLISTSFTITFIVVLHLVILELLMSTSCAITFIIVLHLVILAL